MSGTECDECGIEVPTKRDYPSKWDNMRATGTGWFFMQDGTAYCPDHVPDWVPAWREQKKEQKEQEKMLLIAGYLSTHPGALAGGDVFSNPADYIPIAERVMEIVRGEV